MPSSSVPLCRNGHPTLAPAVACRTCGAPLTTAPATPRATNNRVPTTRPAGLLTVVPNADDRVGERQTVCVSERGGHGVGMRPSK